MKVTQVQSFSTPALNLLQEEVLHRGRMKVAQVQAHSPLALIILQEEVLHRGMMKVSQVDLDADGTETPFLLPVKLNAE